MIDNITIREAKFEDACKITMLKLQVWLHTYAPDGIEDEYADYLDAEITSEKTRILLENPEKKLFLAEKEGRIIACYQLDFDTQCPVQEIDAPELSVLYLSQHFHGKGVGKSLLLHAEQEVVNLGHKSIWLTAYCENHQAIHFYKRQNYQLKGKCYFEMGDSKYENLVFWKELNN
ncbi:GNAT family N-acetyltransferase [Marinifilum caeruleilacunae]|uniref:GNAT family N-acetyltransferase n=1 Tax=Marinifilum caeruleilacunae TaxID=2499076 RepID=A0ABX1WU31_9BACT|nr:GNAT family N-acetyltransferase [Marinifilum caeruleilacunae]NOU59526.1 GNAT family N-acetyltransferase [Marinifilum caeruleilacunae]